MLRFRKPGVTSKGLYKMKKEYIPEFNPFFYHYDKNEQSKVRIHINQIYVRIFVYFKKWNLI